jgi:hypothetical protein
MNIIWRWWHWILCTVSLCRECWHISSSQNFLLILCTTSLGKCKFWGPSKRIYTTRIAAAYCNCHWIKIAVFWNVELQNIGHQLYLNVKMRNGLKHLVMGSKERLSWKRRPFFGFHKVVQVLSEHLSMIKGILCLQASNYFHKTEACWNYKSTWTRTCFARTHNIWRVIPWNLRWCDWSVIMKLYKLCW